MWQTFVGERLELHEMEYNEECANKWADQINREAHTVVHIGDQANSSHLERVLRRARAQAGETPVSHGTGLFDVIVDDGGHQPYQNKASFEYLFPRALKPGGAYFIEDISPPSRVTDEAFCSKHSECKGEMIRWAQEMLSSVLGYGGVHTGTDFDSSSQPLHAPQARWVASVEVSARLIAIFKATKKQCYFGQAFCPGLSKREMGAAARGEKRRGRKQAGG